MNVFELVSPYIRGATLERGRIKGLCPFHDDHKPSFSMSIESGKEGLYHCWSCQASGNLAKFLRKKGLPYATIERIVRELPIPTQKKGYKRLDEDPVLPESVLGAFHECPTALLDAGFSMRLLEAHNIGFDSRRHRITFPLRNVRGDLIGISGRAAYEDINPRYYIYTEHEFPSFKGYRRPSKNFLWNLDQVAARRLEAETEDPIIIVEGFKVCLWLIQHGYKDTVALVGNAMTRGQKEILENFPGMFVLALDNDDAGQSGTYRTGKMLLEIPGVQVHVIDPEVLDRREVHQLDELSGDDLDQVLSRRIPFLSYARRKAEKERKHDRTY